MVRYGRKCTDWLCHRLFLQDVRGSTRVLLTDPVPMLSKDAWAHWHVFRQLLPSPANYIIDLWCCITTAGIVPFSLLVTATSDSFTTRFSMGFEQTATWMPAI